MTQERRGRYPRPWRDWRERLSFSKAKDFILFPGTGEKKPEPNPPWGRGHFDRYYFANCTPPEAEIQVENVTAKYLCDDSRELEVLDTGPIPPMSIGVGIHADGESCKSNHLEIAALVTEPGELPGEPRQEFTYTYVCEIDGDEGKDIVSVVAGISLFWRGDDSPTPLEDIESFAHMYGSPQGCFAVKPEFMCKEPGNAL